VGEPKSLGRIAFEAWMAGDVVAANGKGGWHLTHPRPESWDSHWYALALGHRAVWERIGRAVADHLEGAEETILIEVD
jgi:hypothetical protein